MMLYASAFHQIVLYLDLMIPDHKTEAELARLRSETNQLKHENAAPGVT